MLGLSREYPDGAAGLGLALIRAALGFAAADHAWVLLAGPVDVPFRHYLAAGLALVAGVALILGLLTPVFSTLTAGVGASALLHWIPVPASSPLAPPSAAVALIATAIALAMLGPGAFSIDAPLFGRREVIVPVRSKREW